VRRSKEATTYADYQERALEFSVGDSVVPYYNPVERAGRVVAVFPAIGMIDVEFPHGSKRYPVEEITKLFSDRTWVDTPLSDSTPGAAGTVSVPGGPYPPIISNQIVQKMASRVAQAYVKKALYWAQADRQYRATREERALNGFNCPKCSIAMKPATYKRREGRSEKLLGCPGCLFLIKRDDILTE
jgi:hypothetical protein